MKVQLSELLSKNTVPAGTFYNLDIKGLTSDSRQVRPGYLFAAFKGSLTNGECFIQDAIEQGAVAILVSDELESNPDKESAVFLSDSNPRRKFSIMASRFYKVQPKSIVAVTGTNGKSSVAHFTQQIWDQAGFNAASIGTLGVKSNKRKQELELTTPDSVTLFKTLSELADDGISNVIIEASSHGIHQYRLDGANICAAAYLNLAHDHLDYHYDSESYLNAKAGLFRRIVNSEGTAVINSDDSAYKKMRNICSARSLKIITFGSKDADLRLIENRVNNIGQVMTINCFGDMYEINSSLPGRFQAYNMLASLGLAIATGVSTKKAIKALETLKGVPGRLELIAKRSNGAPIFVDYAHTPDALDVVLKTLRSLVSGRVILVFGCGGDRDKNKRISMGSIASKNANLVIVTDDNPRTEDPKLIRAEILAACPGALEIEDRAQAIYSAISSLNDNDLLLVAGKGHEIGQIIGRKITPFNDAEIIISSLQAINEGI